jgi:hypothetical protein
MLLDGIMEHQKNLMFDDDTACATSETSLERLINLVYTKFTKVARWFRANKTAVNVSKTKLIIFHTKVNQSRITHKVQILHNNK